MSTNTQRLNNRSSLTRALRVACGKVLHARIYFTVMLIEVLKGNSDKWICMRTTERIAASC